jgi:hypothetical protein
MYFVFRIFVLAHAFFVRSYVARLAYLSEGKKDVFKEVSIPVNEDSPLTMKVVAEVAVHIEEAREPYTPAPNATDVSKTYTKLVSLWRQSIVLQHSDDDILAF